MLPGAVPRVGPFALLLVLVFILGCEIEDFSEAADCAPDCNGRVCGADGCGGICGECAPGEACSVSGRCFAFCLADCTGRECGDDGCQDTCGTCTGTTAPCSPQGLCPQ